MAKNMQPIAKRCHALGVSPAVMGYAKKTTHRNPGSQMRRKKGEYALQLQEKQKVKFVYGILEKQFRSYYEKSTSRCCLRRAATRLRTSSTSAIPSTSPCCLW